MIVAEWSFQYRKHVTNAFVFSPLDKGVYWVMICCMQAGIKLIIFSTLEPLPSDVKQALPKVHGDMVVPHFESKALIEVC